jgi:hypothetical protein
MFSKTNKYVHQLVNINIYINMHGATIKILKDPFYYKPFTTSNFSKWSYLYLVKKTN